MIINNSLESQFLQGSSNADSITNSGRYVTIASYGGNDTIVNRAYQTSIDAGTGHNNVSVTATGNVTLLTDEGNDVFNVFDDGSWHGTGWYNLISTAGGNNYLNNAGIRHSTIISGSGDDTVYSGGDKTTINAGVGNNRIFITDGEDANSIVAGKGNDLVSIGSSNSEYNYINVGAGTNTVVALGDRNSVYASGAAQRVTIGGGLVSLNSNAANNVSIGATGDNSVIAGTGNDTVRTAGSMKSGNVIKLSGGNNYVDNGTNYKATISVGNGNDTISDIFDWNTANDFISVSGGDNLIYLPSISSSKIFTGAGNDTIYYGGGTTVDAGDGDNHILITEDSRAGASIVAGVGNDFADVSILQYTNLGAGNNTITGDGGKGTVEALDGDNVISLSNEIYGDGIQVTLGNGNNSLTIGGSVQVSVGNGNNFVSIGRGSVSLGNGNNTVKTDDYSTVTAGSGKNFVTIGGGLVSLNSNKGNDIFLNEGGSVFSGSGNDTINTGKHDDSSYYEQFISVSGGDNYINAINHNASITAGADNDTIFVYGDDSSVVAGAGNNVITLNDVYGQNTIISGKGNDFVSIASANPSIGNNYIDVGAGNDTIVGTFSTFSNSIVAEGGNNFISISGGAGNVIITGTGNDTTTGSEKSDTFVYKGGKDIITNLGYSDRISLAGKGASVLSDITSVAVDKKGNAVITFNSKNTLTLNNVADKDIYINDRAVHLINKGIYETIAPYYWGDTLKSVTLTADFSGTFNAAGYSSVDASAVKKAAKITGDSLDNNFTGGAGADTLNGGKGNDKLTGGKGKDLFIYGAGKDTITDYATGDEISLGSGLNGIKSISFDSLSASLTFAENNSLIIDDVKNKKVTLNGKTLFLSENSYGSSDGKAATLTADFSGKFDMGSYASVSAAAVTSSVTITGNKLDNLILGGKVNDSLNGGNGNDTLSGNAGDDILIGGKNDDSLNGGNGNDTLSGDAGNDILIGGKGNDSLNGGDGDDTLSGDAGNDILIGGKGNDVYTGGTGADVFVYSAGNDTITDYAVHTDKISLGADISKSSISGADLILKIGKGTLTVKDAKEKELTLINSKGMEYTSIFGGLTLNNKSKANVTLPADVKFADASTRTKAINITGNKLNNTIFGGSGNDKLYGAAGNDSLPGNAGNDSLYGGKGNDVYTGGDGADLFIYSAGKDTITDYAEEDKISLASDISKATLSVNDAILATGKGSLTIVDAKNKTLTWVDSKGTEHTSIAGALILDNNSKAKVTLDSDVKVADASKRTKAINITGNKLANSIVGGSKKDSLYGDAGNDTLDGGKGNDNLYGGAGNDSLDGGKGNDKLYGEAGDDILYGGAGNDSLWGDAGNDSLYGGSGNDVFIYKTGDGNDTIFDYDNGDMLKILKSDGSEGGSFSKSSFKNSNLTLAISGGDTVTFNGVSKSDTFNINGTSYKINGKKLAVSN